MSIDVDLARLVELVRSVADLPENAWPKQGWPREATEASAAKRRGSTGGTIRTGQSS